MNYQELEVKLLRADKGKIIKKLEGIGAEYKGTRIQKIYNAWKCFRYGSWYYHW